ncbi:DUF5131 family protein [Candidatus Tokpelaia sp.]|uniref:DUF5131 family protein n=1 Tax=Candidatus Tokpelaia sp. TaxID=2233777 RepID=UPI0012390F15|nr:phage Gp37/Gp68 family protein [Candidatus Tokpelaia sp.]KAA6405815.1 ABC transporter ATP-binding protein [Candidatus Tokpelaia sp.]
MARTNIEWTDAVWNPVAGCSIVSPGCTNCYAMQMASRLAAMGSRKYAGLTRKSGGRAKWTGKIRCNKKSLSVPLKWKKPRRIFVNSMSDLFHPDVPVNFIADIWAIMAATPQHIYQILTKRPERMTEVLFYTYPPAFPFLLNVWLGTSIENSETLCRTKALRKCSGARHFISFEPLLGPVADADLSGIDWVIVGGESGLNARPMEAAWARDLRDKCAQAGIPFFFKQWGKHIPEGQQKGLLDGVLHHDFPLQPVGE